MTLSLKVFGGDMFNHQHKQVRTIVAAHTQKEAAKLTGLSLYYFREYWCETGNDDELSIALSAPGIVFWEATPRRGDFVRKVKQ